jgi:hypothetical protein
MRPRLQQMVTEHLHAVRKQTADFQVLERQLEQVLQRLRTVLSAKHSEARQCLEGAAIPPLPKAPDLPRTRKRGGADMDSHSSMEAITRLATASNRDCDCGCSCADGGALPVKQQELLRLPPRVGASAEKVGPGRSRPDTATDSRPRGR